MAELAKNDGLAILLVTHQLEVLRRAAVRLLWVDEGTASLRDLNRAELPLL